MNVLLQYYTFSPRLRLDAILDMPEPQVGDAIRIPSNLFSEIGKKYKKKMLFSCSMRVVSRVINIGHYSGPLLVIHLRII